MKKLGLLLASERDGKPILENGLPEEATQDAPSMAPKRSETTHLWNEDGLSNLKKQRWGVVLPKGKVGDDLREAIKPLIEARQPFKTAAENVAYFDKMKKEKAAKP